MGSTESKNSINLPSKFYLTNLQFLLHHKDIIRFVLTTDQHQFITAGDDGTINIFDLNHGVLLHSFYSNNTTPLSITAFCSYNQNILLYATIDHHIHLFNLETLNEIPHLENFHKQKTDSDHIYHVNRICNFTVISSSTIPLMKQNKKIHFFTCGNDKKICFWSLNYYHDNDDQNNDNNHNNIESFTTVSSFFLSRCEENVKHLLLLRSYRVVISTDASILFIYNIYHESLEQTLVSNHRENITNLYHLDEDRFLSVSLCGAMIIWSDVLDNTPIKPLQILNYYDYYKEPARFGHRHFYSIGFINPFDKKSILMGIDDSIVLFDFKTEKFVFTIKHAHTQPLISAIPLYHHHIVASACVCEIRFWSIRDSSGNIINGEHSAYDCLITVVSPHSCSINMLLSFTHYSMISIDISGALIIWKDSRIYFEYHFKLCQQYNQNNKIISFNTPQNYDINFDEDIPNSLFSILPIPSIDHTSYTLNTPLSEKTKPKDTFSFPFAVSNLFPNDLSSETKLLHYIQYLQYNYHLNKAEICFELRSQGIPDNLIEKVLRMADSTSTPLYTTSQSIEILSPPDNNKYNEDTDLIQPFSLSNTSRF